MSSWAALKCYIVMKTVFKPKNIKSESFGILIIEILDFIEEYAKLFPSDCITLYLVDNKFIISNAGDGGGSSIVW